MDEVSVTQLVSARIPTRYGEFQMVLYDNTRDAKEHLALVMGNVRGTAPVLVRVHSECLTGDVFGSRRCDCGEQLDRAMAVIAEAGAGVIVYLRQEGRGIGLLDKLRAYNLQDDGYDTVEANLLLGHAPDERDYGIAAAILRDLGVCNVRLLTNNPAKLSALDDAGIHVVEPVALVTNVYVDNLSYLKTKAERMAHLIDASVLGLDKSSEG